METRSVIKLAMSLAVAVFMSFDMLAAADDYFLPAVYIEASEIQGLDPTGFIPDGPVDLVIPIRFVNIGEARTAISNGFEFRGDGVTYSSISAEWNPAFPWGWPQAVELGIFPPYFDWGVWFNYFDHGVGFAGLTGSAGSGLPVDFDGIAYFVTLNDVFAESGGKLVIDSSYWPPAMISNPAEFLANSIYSVIVSNAFLSITPPRKFLKSQTSPILMSASSSSIRSRNFSQIKSGTYIRDAAEHF